MLGRLRDFIRRQFTRVVLTGEKQSSMSPDAARNPRTRSKRRRFVQVAVSPSERFVWGMVTLIVALVGVIALEVVCILVTGAFNSELLAVISGLVGSLVTAFVMGKKS